MPDAPYIYLHDINGNPIKPVTDLAALNVTTTNGIHIEPVNGGTIGIRDGYIQSSYYLSMMDTQAGPARQDEEAFVSGGTMYTLLGGYAVTSDVPPATAASEYRVPSEKAVREAIDAYVATGGSDIVAGKGIDMGGGQINATEATVEETLKGYTVSGGTTTVPFDDQVVMPYDLRGALSLGQAVDVSCAPRSISNGTIIPDVNGGFLSGVTWVVNAGVSFSAMGYAFDNFPKFANGLVYLWIFDIENQGSNSAIISKSENCTAISGTWIDVASTRTLAAGDTKRVAVTFNVARPHIDCSTGGATLRMTNYRIYEVTALTDEAIAYIAQLPDPDAWFRSNARSVNERYLVKPDMVSPWIPIIRMSTNSTALTVGAGLAYAVDVFGGTYTIGVDTFPEDAYGQDAHLELFVKAGSHVTFQPPLSLMDPLQENAGHNITIKFREGRATAHVEDTNYGYIINTASGTDGTQAGGSLYFAINGSTSNYAIFSAQLDGSTVTTPNVTANKDITIMGNGTDKTFISGTFGAASGKQLVVKDLTATSVSLSGTGTVAFSSASVKDTETAGTVRFIDTAIPTGSTVTGSSSTTWDVESLQVDGEFRLYKTTATLDQAPIYLRPYYGAFTLTGSGLLDLAGSGIWLTANSSISGLKIVNSHAWSAISTIINAGDICTISDCVFENNHTRAINVSRGDLYVTGCTITGTTASNMRGVALTASDDGTMYVNNCLIKDNVTNWESVYTTGTNSALYITGSTIHDVCSIIGVNSYAEFRDCLLVKAPAAVYRPSNAHMTVYNHTLVRSDDVVATIDSAQVDQITADGYVYNRYGAITIPDSISLWVTSNFIFMSPLDLSKATTVQLKNTVLSGASYVAKSPSQIQLPANSLNSFSGNTTAAGTKILKAGTIIVGDDRTNPTGSATIEFVGGSTALSGIGTYIAKDGTNDFVPIAGNVTSVTTATGTGAGSLQYALTSGTKYAKLANNLNASAGALTANGKTIVTSEYEPILGGSFSVATGGTMVVNEATKTTTISGASITMSSVEIPTGATVATPGGVSVISGTSISGNGVIDLSSHNIHAGASSTEPLYISGCTITGGITTQYGQGAAIYQFRGRLTCNDCLFTGNKGNATEAHSVIGTAGNGQITLTNCVFSANTSIHGAPVSPTNNMPDNYIISCTFKDNTGAVYGGALSFGAPCVVSACTFENNTATYGSAAWNNAVPASSLVFKDCHFGVKQAICLNGVNDSQGTIPKRGITLQGSNYFGNGAGIYCVNGYNNEVIVDSGAIIDLTGNSTTLPINPCGNSASLYGGGITFAPGGATVYPSAGSASAYVLGGIKVPQIGNTNVVNLNNKNIVHDGIAYASRCTITGGSATQYGGAFNVTNTTGDLSLTSCIVSGNSIPTTGNCFGGGIRVNGGKATVVSSIISGNIGQFGKDVYVDVGGSLSISGSTVGHIMAYRGATVTFSGDNKLERLNAYMTNSGAFVVIFSGASINLTSSIDPVGGITVKTGGCIINNTSFGSPSSDTVYTSIVSSGGGASGTLA